MKKHNTIETLERLSALELTDATKSTELCSDASVFTVEFAGAYDAARRLHVDGELKLGGWSRLDGKGLVGSGEPEVVDIMEHQTFGGWVDFTGFLADGRWAKQGLLLPRTVKLEHFRAYRWSSNGDDWRRQEVELPKGPNRNDSLTSVLVLPQTGLNTLNQLYWQRCYERVRRGGYDVLQESSDLEVEPERFVVFTDFGFTRTMRETLTSPENRDIPVEYRRVYDLREAHEVAQTMGAYDEIKR